MVIAVCVDERYGMLFNHRRQSADRKMQDRLLDHAAGKTLWMNSYSAKLFSQLPQNVRVRADFLQMAEPDDVCFVENIPFADADSKCDRLILYCWNRKYPADTYFPEALLQQWTLLSTCDFEGSSHERITEKIYEKK